MASYRYVICDVFTDTALAGNPLAVFTDGRGLSDATMQALALEIGFSETVFVLPPEQGGTAKVRIFTPVSELPFAGHPILGTAWVLGAPLQRAVIDLETAMGVIPVTLERDESGKIVFGRMVQPVPTVAPYSRAEELCAALGVEQTRAPIELYCNGPEHILVLVASVERVGRVSPDRGALAVLGDPKVSCFAGDGQHWTTRMLWAHGEDPATGSAAGPIACHLARHGFVEWGSEIVLSQGAAVGRPSTLYARAEGSPAGITAVEVGGSAVVVARGEFRLPHA